EPSRVVTLVLLEIDEAVVIAVDGREVLAQPRVGLFQRDFAVAVAVLLADAAHRHLGRIPVAAPRPAEATRPHATAPVLLSPTRLSPTATGLTPAAGSHSAGRHGALNHAAIGADGHHGGATRIPNERDATRGRGTTALRERRPRRFASRLVIEVR